MPISRTRIAQVQELCRDFFSYVSQEIGNPAGIFAFRLANRESFNRDGVGTSARGQHREKRLRGGTRHRHIA